MAKYQSSNDSHLWQVVASNVPSGSGWQYTLFGNSLVVTCVQMAFDQLIAPRLVAILARVKFGFKRSTDLSSEYIIFVYQSQETNAAGTVHVYLSVECCRQICFF